MIERVIDTIGIMDPNQFSFRAAIEGLISHLALDVPYEGKLHRVVTRRLKSRPYDVLRAVSPYRAILNRGAHWNPHHNSYLMTVGPTTYLVNDMVSFLSVDKNASYGHMKRLGLHIPPTAAIPQQDYSELLKDPKVNPDLIFPDHEMFDLKEVGDEIGYPAYLKPQSGGGWSGVTRVESFEELEKAYKTSGDRPMNLQRAIDYREFVRTVGIGPQMYPMHYNPRAKLSHDRYLRGDGRAIQFDFLDADEFDEVSKITKVINAFYNWDHNSCESLIDHDGVTHPIDFANAYPDSSLVSLHYYFPDLVKGMVKWLVFNAVTARKKPSFGRDWPEFFAIMEEAQTSGWGYREKLNAYAKLADEHFEAARFYTFCDDYLPNFDAQALDFFGSEVFQHIIEEEVQRYFKMPQERPQKLSHYMGIHRFWLHCERDRLARLV